MGEAKRRRAAAVQQQEDDEKVRERVSGLVRQGADLVREMMRKDATLMEKFGNATWNRNEVLNDYQKYIEKRNASQCMKGCSFCCYQMVSAPPLDIFLIAYHLLKTWPTGDLEVLVRRMEKVSALPMTSADRWPVCCPFLSNHLCTIYEQRPLSCRGHFSASAKACKDQHENGIPEANIPFLYGPKEVCSGLQLGMDYAMFEAAGVDTRRVELCGALLRVLPDLDKAWERWASGDATLFAGCHDETMRHEIPDAPSHFVIMLTCAAESGIIGGGELVAGAELNGQ